MKVCACLYYQLVYDYDYAGVSSFQNPLQKSYRHYGVCDLLVMVIGIV